MWSRAMVLFIKTKNRLYISNKHEYKWRGSELPEWVTIYYARLKHNEMKCNICEAVLETDEKSMELLEHIQINHNEVYELHKENPEAPVGFRIEFLHLNVLKDDGDPKTQPVIIGEVCEATTEEEKPLLNKDISYDSEIVLTTLKNKGGKRASETRKKSWVWKYFKCINNTIYRCTLCEAVISIKACNTNNMNRHIRMKHQIVYDTEVAGKLSEQHDTSGDLDPMINNEMSTVKIHTKEKSHKQLQRRSWIWQYFDRISSRLAQCKLCERIICHGGHATGNMNRHLKMIHHKTGPEDHTWIWKVFDRNEDDYYTCKICQYRFTKFTDADKSTSSILNHLKLEHGVVSGDQIITSYECDED